MNNDVYSDLKLVWERLEESVKISSICIDEYIIFSVSNFNRMFVQLFRFILSKRECAIKHLQLIGDVLLSGLGHNEVFFCRGPSTHKLYES